MMTKRLLVMLCFVVTFANGVASGATLGETSQRRAEQVLNRAVVAIGGAEALNAIRTIKLEINSEEWPYKQTPSVRPPFQPTRVEQKLLLDLATNRTRVDVNSLGRGFETRTTLIVKNGEGMGYNHRTMAKRPLPRQSPPVSPAGLAPYSRLLPNLLLRQAMSSTDSLRYLGRADFEKRLHDVITYVGPDAIQVTVYIDVQTGMLSKYETMSQELVLGSRATEVIFSDYVSLGAQRVPKLSTRRYAGMLSARSQLTTEINPTGIDKDFEFSDAGYGQSVPNAASQDMSARVERLGDNVIVLHNIAAANYNAMAVAFKDYVVAVEAPWTSEGSDKVIARIKQEFPGKPIRYVVVTHHHGDHIGGIRSYIAEGATVIATRSNKEVIDEMASMSLKDRLGSNPRKPEYLFVDGAKRVISDGEQTLELLQVGPLPHADDMLIAHVPKARAIFQADLFFPPRTDGPLGPPEPGTVAFARRLTELGLSFERIAGVHGYTASNADFIRVLSGGAQP